MDHDSERRHEERLGYRWPVWFGETFGETMTQGLMADISSDAIAFECGPGDQCPSEGQHLTVRFGIPRFEGDDPTATVSMTRTGYVCRIDKMTDTVLRVAVMFEVPLPLRPAEVSTLSALCSGGAQS
jgi:hypothetical protein